MTPNHAGGATDYTSWHGRDKQQEVSPEMVRSVAEGQSDGQIAPADNPLKKPEQAPAPPPRRVAILN